MMRTTPTRKTGFAVSIFLLISALVSWAAKMPISDEDREKQATHIVTGNVIEVKSEIKNSTIEKGPGNKDEIFSITVMVETVRKGGNVKKGDKIVVVAWNPNVRVGLAQIGLQGHDPIPKKGQAAEFFLQRSKDGFKPLLPNGMAVKPKAGDDAADAQTSTAATGPWKDVLDEAGEGALRTTNKKDSNPDTPKDQAEQGSGGNG